MDSLRSLSGHWKELSPLSLLLGGLGWLFRRQGIHPWRALTSQVDLNKEIAVCRRDLASAEASRANEQRLREYAMEALAEMVKSGKAMGEALDEGRLTISGRSSRKPTRSHRSSGGSPPTRKRGPLEIP